MAIVLYSIAITGAIGGDWKEERVKDSKETGNGRILSDDSKDG